MVRSRALPVLRFTLLFLLSLIAAACAAGGLPEPGAVAAEGWGQGTPHAGAVEVHTDPGELPGLEVAEAGRPRLPLEHTHVKARLSGFFADVEVSQTYRNSYDHPINAVYVFPLPENSAVDHLKMVIGPRVIEAEVDERKAAKKTFERARRAGHTAALVEQERPNVFTQSVANIAPLTKIDVVVHYLQDLTYDAGEYEFVFPTVVGPRYIPGAPVAGSSGSGTRADTDRVPDAARITPAVMGRGQRSGHDISIEVIADAALPIGELSVPTHEVISRRPADGTLRVTLAEKDAIPNRDFVMRYRVAGREPRAALYTSGGRSGHFALIVHPPALDVDRLVGRREIVFVVDVSGSMRGAPLALCQAAMRRAIRHLRPVDTFNIITFSGATGQAFPAPRPANDATVREALAYVDKMVAGGRTEMSDAVKAALGLDVERGRRRYVFFLTDGLTGEEARIAEEARSFVEALGRKGQEARVFGLGVGSSPNRAMIEALSRAGRGVAVFAGNREDPGRAVNRFFRYIDRSVLRDLHIDWGSLEPAELFPRELPDLFASHPLIVHGRYTGEAKGPIVVRGTVNDDDLAIPVQIRLSATPDAPKGLLGTLWARAKIGSLEEALWAGSNPDAEKAITALGIEHHLVTSFTSLIAVDRSQRVGDGHAQTIAQPVEIPEGVDPEMSGATSDPLDSICSIDPSACHTIDMNKMASRAENTKMYAVQQTYRRACGCRAAGADGEGSAEAWGAAALAAAVLALRVAKRRSARSGP